MELFEAQDAFDAEAECRALRPGREDAIFAIAGSGDHVLALLNAAPKLIMAVDPRPAQAHLLELKIAALKALSYVEMLELLGARESRRRRGLYHRVRWLLTADADAFWMSQLSTLERGVLSQGRRERSLAGFRRFVRLVQGARRVDRFLALSDPRVQADVLIREWDGFVWRRFAGHVLASALGRRDGDACVRRLEALMTSAPACDNSLLAWVLSGHYGAALPFHLREDAFDTLKTLANRIVVVCDRPDRALAAMPDESFDRFAFGDAWESLGDVDALAREIGRTGRPGARLAARTNLDVEPFLPIAARATAVVDGADRSPAPGGFWEATLAEACVIGGIPT